MANGLSDVAVAAGLAVWDFEQRMPTRELELGSAKIEREGKLASPAREVMVEFAEIGREGWFGLTQLSRIGIQLLHAGLEFESHQTFGGSGQKEGADGGRRADVEQSFHLALEDSTMSCGDGAPHRPLPQIKNPPVFTEGLLGEGTTTTSAVHPEKSSVWCPSKQAAPDCSSGG